MTKIYTRPVLRLQGQLEAMTHGMSDGSNLDATFPIGTPKNELTFS